MAEAGRGGAGPTGRTKSPIKASGLVLKGRWRVKEEIGSGGFGSIYRATDGKRQVAVKCESNSVKRSLIKMEVTVLKELQGEPSVVKYYGCGRAATFNYMVMGLIVVYPQDMRRVRSSLTWCSPVYRPHQKFSFPVLYEISKQMLAGIRCVHEHGILHRDIKPSNFAVGRSDPTRLYIFDFGLARIYANEEGRVRAARAFAGFRGTARYASLQAHANRELGRCDDLWSYLYTVVELGTAALPWRKLKDKKEIALAKKDCAPATLLAGLQPGFLAVHALISMCTYADEPDYDAIVAELAKMADADIGTERALESWATAMGGQNPHQREAQNGDGAPQPEPTQVNESPIGHIQGGVRHDPDTIPHELPEPRLEQASPRTRLDQPSMTHSGNGADVAVARVVLAPTGVSGSHSLIAVNDGLRPLSPSRGLGESPESTGSKSGLTVSTDQREKESVLSASRSSLGLSASQGGSVALGRRAPRRAAVHAKVSSELTKTEDASLSATSNRESSSSMLSSHDAGGRAEAGSAPDQMGADTHDGPEERLNVGDSSPPPATFAPCPPPVAPSTVQRHNPKKRMVVRRPLGS